MTSPSTVEPDARYIVRVYRDDPSDVQVYDNVKHFWLTGGGAVLVILQYMDDGSHRYVHWPLARLAWWQSARVDA